jgi:hypothetical protein
MPLNINQKPIVSSKRMLGVMKIMLIGLTMVSTAAFWGTRIFANEFTKMRKYERIPKPANIPGTYLDLNNK